MGPNKVLLKEYSSVDACKDCKDYIEKIISSIKSIK